MFRKNMRKGCRRFGCWFRVFLCKRGDTKLLIKQHPLIRTTRKTKVYFCTKPLLKEENTINSDGKVDPLFLT